MALNAVRNLLGSKKPLWSKESSQKTSQTYSNSCAKIGGLVREIIETVNQVNVVYEENANNMGRHAYVLQHKQINKVKRHFDAVIDQVTRIKQCKPELLNATDRKLVLTSVEDLFGEIKVLLHYLDADEERLNADLVLQNLNFNFKKVYTQLLALKSTLEFLEKSKLPPGLGENEGQSSPEPLDEQAQRARSARVAVKSFSRGVGSETVKEGIEKVLARANRVTSFRDTDPVNPMSPSCLQTFQEGIKYSESAVKKRIHEMLEAEQMQSPERYSELYCSFQHGELFPSKLYEYDLKGIGKDMKRDFDITINKTRHSCFDPEFGFQNTRQQDRTIEQFYQNLSLAAQGSQFLPEQWLTILAWMYQAGYVDMQGEAQELLDDIVKECGEKQSDLVDIYERNGIRLDPPKIYELIQNGHWSKRKQVNVTVSPSEIVVELQPYWTSITSLPFARTVDEKATAPFGLRLDRNVLEATIKYRIWMEPMGHQLVPRYELIRKWRLVPSQELAENDSNKFKIIELVKMIDQIKIDCHNARNNCEDDNLVLTIEATTAAIRTAGEVVKQLKEDVKQQNPLRELENELVALETQMQEERPEEGRLSSLVDRAEAALVIVEKAHALLMDSLGFGQHVANFGSQNIPKREAAVADENKIDS